MKKVSTMTTFNPETPAPCDAEMRMNQAAYALEQMNGPKVYDLGHLLHLLRGGECEDHNPAGHARGGLRSVPTSSSPLNLDPHDAYYRPPYIGRADEYTTPHAA